MKLILKLVTPYGRATSVRARRVTRLNHELFNAAMKYVTVVVGVARSCVVVVLQSSQLSLELFCFLFKTILKKF